ncbi:MAG: metal-dependent hydrolase [Armatimonadetes bacterium]|nr:metal-dependent hydrolase [Armatimonadota bacterium]
MKITYAGHSAVFLSLDGFDLAIDPWLEGNPCCPDRLKNPEKFDVIVLTHGHGDHASDAVRVQKLTGAKVVACFELADLLIEAGIPAESVLHMGVGGTHDFGNGWSISLTHAIHSNSFETDRGKVYAGIAAGVIVKSPSHTIFHSGDTSLFSDLELIGEEHNPDIAFLSVGGNFTMNMKEGVRAARWLGVRAAVPIHFKTFPILAQSADPFLSGCTTEGIRGTEMNPGDETTAEKLLGG